MNHTGSSQQRCQSRDSCSRLSWAGSPVRAARHTALTSACWKINLSPKAQNTANSNINHRNIGHSVFSPGTGGTQRGGGGDDHQATRMGNDGSNAVYSPPCCTHQELQFQTEIFHPGSNPHLSKTQNKTKKSFKLKKRKRKANTMLGYGKYRELRVKQQDCKVPC